MFFRRKPPKQIAFPERLEALRRLGFRIETMPDGVVRADRGRVGAEFEQGNVRRAGRLLAGEIAVLVDGGFQKFWEAAGGRKVPALAEDLKELHAAEEDIKEALGLESLYNTSLGTVNTLHRYDRLRGRAAH